MNRCIATRMIDSLTAPPHPSLCTMPLPTIESTTCCLLSRLLCGWHGATDFGAHCHPGQSCVEGWSRWDACGVSADSPLRRCGTACHVPPSKRARRRPGSCLRSGSFGAAETRMAGTANAKQPVWHAHRADVCLVAHRVWERDQYLAVCSPGNLLLFFRTHSSFPHTPRRSCVLSRLLCSMPS